MMNRQYVPLWSWFYEFGRMAAVTNDEQRLRLYRLHDSAFAQREKNPEYGLTLYREAVALAEHLKEPCMTLFYEYWVGEMLVFYLSRYEEGLDFVTRIVTKASQETYLNCPVRARVFITLIAAYYAIDALSYVDEMQAMIETMDRQIPLDDDTHARLYAYRAEIEILISLYDAAMQDALKYLEMSDMPAQEVQAYHILCSLTYLQHHDQQTLEYAYLMQQTAMQSSSNELLVASYCWQATMLSLKGEREEAERLFILGMAEANTLTLPDSQTILYGTCRYYEARGEYEKLLAMWDKQIQLMNPRTPNRQTYFYTFLRRCFVLRRLGRLSEADIEQTRQAALRMRKPEKYLARIDELHKDGIEIPRY
jgi:hypothetical protein